MTISARTTRRSASLMARQESAYHEARLLILMSAFTDPGEEFVGLTKLVKLDFLLRYPMMTTRLLPPQIYWPAGTGPTEAEEKAVESRMVRYKYGPWDDRYYPLLGALAGKHLIRFSRRDRFGAVVTDHGREAAVTLSRFSEWSVVARRAEFLKDNFNLTGAELKERIYAGLPDVVDLPMKSEI
ncbi:hypothetical protein AB0K27_08235 [Micromonospora echinospora]|uniref:hypothetical protein n=1 Tax=Micromonospora echinospora TaxID=1877 RepID=UPI0034349D8B